MFENVSKDLTNVAYKPIYRSLYPVRYKVFYGPT